MRKQKIISEEYVWLYKPEHPNSNSRGYIPEHRFIMSEILGRPLTSKEFVHHKNHNRQDNRPENLQLISDSDHSALHNPRMDMSDRECSNCGTKKSESKKLGYGNKPYGLWAFHPVTKKLLCLNCYCLVKYHIKKELLK